MARRRVVLPSLAFVAVAFECGPIPSWLRPAFCPTRLEKSLSLCCRPDSGRGHRQGQSEFQGLLGVQELASCWKAYISELMNSNRLLTLAFASS